MSLIVVLFLALAYIVLGGVIAGGSQRDVREPTGFWDHESPWARRPTPTTQRVALAVQRRRRHLATSMMGGHA